MLNEQDKQLWIKLNAQHQISWESGLTWFNKATNKYEPTQQAIHPRSIEIAMDISAKQYEHDVSHGKLRFTLEELLTLDTLALNEISATQHQDWCMRFETLT